VSVRTLRRTEFRLHTRRDPSPSKSRVWNCCSGDDREHVKHGKEHVDSHGGCRVHGFDIVGGGKYDRFLVVITVVILQTGPTAGQSVTLYTQPPVAY